MATIPASQIVSVLPNVLSAGGSQLVLNGMMLTQNPRVPVGQVLSFPNDGVSVSKYFGASSQESSIAATYFLGFNNSTQKPNSIFFTQYPGAAISAYLRGGNAASLTLAQLQALSGSLSVIMDGYISSAASISLAAASSFSAAAALIQTGIDTAEPVGGVMTASIAASTNSFTGSIAGNILTVTAVASGIIVPGTIVAGTGVTAGTRVTSQLSGAAGAIGTYAVSAAQVVASQALTGGYGTMTVTAVTSGTFAVGQTLTGTGVTANTQITGLGTGAGLTGTYYVQTSQTTASTSITGSATPVLVTYDSVSGAFIVTSGIVGPNSTAAFATGTLAASLFLTAATGAVLSQGAAATTPSAFMAALTQTTQNWASFMTLFDPDGGTATVTVGNTQKQAFAAWVNTTNRRYAYIAWDTDVTPTLSASATTSLAAILASAASDGTCVIYDPANGPTMAAFICGAAASIDFTATNGRITFAFRGQSGLVAGVTSSTVAANLIANGYNFYGAYATASQQFLEFQPGSVSGVFQWLDSYVNEIWLNAALQQALMVYLQNVNSVPYNNQGYEGIKAACADPINAALNFGAMRVGVTLSASQAAQINSSAGTKVSDVLQYQGWYLQVVNAAPQVRQARTSPPMNLWYCDGQSIQNVILNSVLVQ
jgi:hypothetical protein